MTRTQWVLLTVTLLAVGAISANDAGHEANTWVSSDGETFVVRSGGATSHDDARITEIDLSDVRDGETRTFPAEGGDIEATRKGDIVTVSGPGIRPDHPGGIGALTCDLSDSSCDLSIVSLGEGHRAVMLNSRGGCAGEDCPQVFAVSRSIACAGEDCGMRVGHAGRVELRCPEGDTVMNVDRERADEVFLCPDHSLQLERSTRAHRAVFIEVRGDEDRGEY